MKKTFNKIELPASLPQIFPIKVKFDSDEYLYDFGKAFDDEISRLVAKVFFDKYSKLTARSRRSSYLTVIRFLKYLQENKVTKYNDLDEKSLVGYALLLEKQKLSLNSKSSNYSIVVSFLQDAKKLKDSPLKELKVPANPFRNAISERAIPNKINAVQMKKVLSLCYEKIDLYFNKFQLAQEKMKEIEVNKPLFNPSDKFHVMHFILNKYGYAPFKNEMCNKDYQLVKKSVGMDELTDCISPNTNVLLPFYIILVMELAGNSDAIRQIKVNCIQEDPLFEDRCFVLWDKARTSKEQRRNVFKNKKYGAYKVIQMVLEMTRHTRLQTLSKNKEFLFLTRGGQEQNKFNLPHEKGFTDELKVFCKENSLDFNFNPSEIRPSVLTEMYKSRKDIIGVSKIANHSRIETTLLYVVDEEIKKENMIYLSQKQNDIVDNLIRKETQENIENFESPAESLGFSCKKPISNNRVCINWMTELTNPELIIPADSQYLSKIIALKNSILNVEKIMEKERFKLLYSPVLEVIKNQIIPKFSQKLVKESEEIAKNIKLPILGEE